MLPGARCRKDTEGTRRADSPSVGTRANPLPRALGWAFRPTAPADAHAFHWVMDIHDMYELCVQSPGHVVPMLRAIHGGGARVLGEDFAGTAAVSRAWCAGDAAARAIAVDLDGALLARAAGEARIERVAGDVRTATDAARHAVDVLFVGNFSIGYLHTRGELVGYMRHAASRLNEGGVVVCDTYGGESAFRLGSVERVHPLPPERAGEFGAGCKVRYTWEQRGADPLTGMVTNVLHFRIERGRGRDREVVGEFPEAFTYRWRLWSVPELRDAMAEAGLGCTAVFGTMPDAVDGEGRAYVEPVTGDDVGESFIVLVAGRRSAGVGGARWERGGGEEAGGGRVCEAPAGWWDGGG